MPDHLLPEKDSHGNYRYNDGSTIVKDEMNRKWYICVYDDWPQHDLAGKIIYYETAEDAAKELLRLKRSWK